MRPLSLLAAASLALLSTGCVSAFPPSSLDYGRGPTPLEAGTLRIQAGGGGGIAPLFIAGGGAAGARAEVQVSRHIAVGLDAGAGLQVQPALIAAPFGGHVSTQINPGLDWLALRGSLGAGGDAIAIGNATTMSVLPWVSGAGALVLGVPEALMPLNAFEPYLSMNLGFRRYAGLGFSPDGPSLGTVPYDNVFAAGLTLGSAWYMNDVLSLYAAANGTMVVMGFGSGGPYEPIIAFSPALSLQAGVAFAF